VFFLFCRKMLSKVAIVFAALVVCAAAAPLLGEDEYQALFIKFVKDHKKEYSHDVFFHRFNVFKTNMDFVIRHNMQEKKSYSVAMNAFGDLTKAEHKKLHTGLMPKKHHNKKHHSKKVHSTIPAGAAIDWRTKGAVNAVQNQQQCGSCWAFSAIQAVESAWFLAKGTLEKLSEQELVDCSQAQGNQGCEGGLMDQAFTYIIADGICTEADYPYTAADGTCPSPLNCTTAATLTSFTDLPSPANEQTDILPAATQQPLSIAIEADQQSFQFYSGGVYNDPGCGTALDHGVGIVGYGTDPTGGDYWLVRNSWGADWGEAGYIRLARGSNVCGLTADVSYPVV